MIYRSLSPARPASDPDGRDSRHCGVRRQPPLAWVIAALAGFALLAGFVLLPHVRAQTEQIFCLVPRLGIRACGPPALVAQQPVSVTQGAAKLTISQLLSSDNATIVRLEISGLRSAAPPITGLETENDAPRVVLVAPSGRRYSGEGRSWMQTPSGSSWTLASEWRFPLLPAETRSVRIEVAGGPSLGTWTAQAPLIPTGKAGLPLARAQTGSVTRQDVTFMVQRTAADAEQTAIQITAQTSTPNGVVRNLGTSFSDEHLVLRDDQRRTYEQLPSAQPPILNLNGAASVTGEIRFPALPATIKTAAVEIPAVSLEEATALATVRIPVSGRQIGDQILVQQSYTLGQHRFWVTGASIVEEHGEARLVLHLDFDSQQGGAILVGPGAVSSRQINAHDFEIVHNRDTGQWTDLSMPLPPQSSDPTELTFRDAVIVVQGPWSLPVTLPAA